MKILLITYSLKGGAGKACHRLYEALKSVNSEIKILYLDGFLEVNPDIQPYFNSKSKFYINQVSGQIHNKLATIFYKKDRLLYKKPFLHTWLKYHVLFDWADIINLHWLGNTLNWRVFFKKVKKPIVWTLHDMLPFSGGYHYSCETEHKISNLAIETEKKKTRYLRYSKIAIVAPSQWLLEVSKNHLPFKGLEHTRIFNCISSDFFKPIEKEISRSILGLPQDKKIILFSADNIQSIRKGYNLLIDAIKSMRDLNIFLLSIGKGARQTGLDVPNKELGMLYDEYSLSLAYSCADIIVVPSIEDNSPNIILESFACGRPVVGFNVGGIPELINDLELGFIIEQIGSKELELGIRKALDKKYDAKYIRRNFQARFHYEVAQRKYNDLFLTLCSKADK